MNFGVTLVQSKVIKKIFFTLFNIYSLKTKANSRYYSNIGVYNKNKLNPNFITGFIDAEGSFIIIVRKEARNKTG